MYADGLDSPHARNYTRQLTDVAIALGSPTLPLPLNPLWTLLCPGVNASDAQREMEEVVRLETALAGIASPDENRRGNQNRMCSLLPSTAPCPCGVPPAGPRYNKQTLSELSRSVPGVALYDLLSKAFPASVGIRKDEVVNLREKDYFRALQRVMRDFPPATIQNYIVWRVLQHFALFLPKAAKLPM